MKILIVLLLVFLAVVGAADVWEDSDTIVKSAIREYMVTHENGAEDRFVYEFTAHVTAYMREKGSASSLSNLKLIDDRECEYRVGAYFRRMGYWTTAGGHFVPYGKVHKTYTDQFSWSHENTTLEELLGMHSPCGDYQAHFASLKKSLTDRVHSEFDVFITQKKIFDEAKNDGEHVVSGATFAVVK